MYRKEHLEESIRLDEFNKIKENFLEKLEVISVEYDVLSIRLIKSQCSKTSTLVKDTPSEKQKKQMTIENVVYLPNTALWDDLNEEYLFTFCFSDISNEIREEKKEDLCKLTAYITRNVLIKVLKNSPYMEWHETNELLTKLCRNEVLILKYN